MGFFSWRCAKTDLPILAGAKRWPGDLRHLCEAVLVLPSGTTVHGTYDGSGRLGMASVKGDQAEGLAAAGNLSGVPDARLVLGHAYAGERHDDLKPSRDDPGQGFFHDDDALRDLIMGLEPLPEMDDREFDEVANGLMGGRFLKSSLEREAMLGKLRDGIRDAAAAADPATVHELRRQRDALVQVPVGPRNPAGALAFGAGDVIRTDLGGGMSATVYGPRAKDGPEAATVHVRVGDEETSYTNFVAGIPSRRLAGKGPVDMAATDGELLLKSGKLVFLLSTADGAVAMDIWIGVHHQAGNSRVWPAAMPAPDDGVEADFRP